MKKILALVILLIAIPLCVVVWAGLDAAGGDLINCTGIVSSNGFTISVAAEPNVFSISDSPLTISLASQFNCESIGVSRASPFIRLTNTGSSAVMSRLRFNHGDINKATIGWYEAGNELRIISAGSIFFGENSFVDPIEEGAGGEDDTLVIKTGSHRVGVGTATPSEKFNIKASGDIGTVDPCAVLDDLTAAGTFVGTVSDDVDYKVEIDANDTPDTFKWSDDGGSTWDASGVAITGSAQTLNNGIAVTFGATDGHDLGDYWEFTVTVHNPMWLQDAAGDGIMYVGNDGKIGINTESPATIFDVNGTITASATSGNIAINAQTASAGNALLYLYGHKLGTNATLAGVVFLNDEDSVAQITAYRYGGDDAADLIFKTQPTGGDVTTRLTISSAGNFDFAAGNIDTTGIGTFGVGGVRLEDGSGDHLSLVSVAVLGGSDLTLTIDPDDSHRTLKLSGNPTLADWFDQPVKAASTGVAFGDLAVNTNTLVVDAVNHRVGIGTNAPDSIFHIKANTPGTVGSHPAGQLIIQDPDDTVFGNVVITGYESDGDGNPDQQLWYLGSSSGSNTDITFLNRRNASLHLGTNGVSRLTILGNGNVGINVTDPDAKLEVVGTLHVSDAATFDGTLGAGAITGTSFITGGDIGVAGDTDLLQLAANALTVNGDVTATGNVQGANLLVETNILHVGDADTGIFFLEDEFSFKAGNLNMLTVVEHGLGNQILFNTAGADIDFTVEAVGQTHALFVQGSDGKVGIRDNAPGSVLDVTGDINTTEQYKVDDVQVVGAQEAHIVDADATVAAAAGGDPPTEAEFNALVTAYNDLATKFNTLLAHLDADAGHGLLAGAP